MDFKDIEGVVKLRSVMAREELVVDVLQAMKEAIPGLKERLNKGTLTASDAILLGALQAK